MLKFTVIDDEFNTVDDILQGPQIKNPESEEKKSTTDINDEMDKIANVLHSRDAIKFLENLGLF